jgi:predicted small lipoprotein YifL
MFMKKTFLFLIAAALITLQILTACGDEKSPAD